MLYDEIMLIEMFMMVVCTFYTLYIINLKDIFLWLICLKFLLIYYENNFKNGWKL